MYFVPHKINTLFIDVTLTDEQSVGIEASDRDEGVASRDVLVLTIRLSMPQSDAFTTALNQCHFYL